MNLDEIIVQLKTYCPTLGGNIAGAANFAVGIESATNLPLPSAFVIPLEDEAGENEELPGLRQVIGEKCGVVVCFANDVAAGTGDRRGQIPARDVDAMRKEIFGAILNWKPPDASLPATKALQYAGGRLLDFDRARLFWQFDFRLDTLVTDSDGFIPGGPPLTKIELIVESADGQTTLTGGSVEF